MQERRREEEAERRWLTEEFPRRLQDLPSRFRVKGEGGFLDLARCRIAQARFDELVSLRLEPPLGLLLDGPSGTLKTTIELRRAIEFAKWTRKPVAFVRYADFGAVISASIAEDSSIRSYVESLETVPWLIVDDITKGRFTSPVQAAFYRVIDKRYTEGLVTEYSTEFSGERFARLLDPDFRDAIFRRITESSQHVSLGLADTPRT